MPKEAHRFGAREVTSGPFKGGLHVATKGYQAFFAELLYFHDYLSRRLLPAEPEEALMQAILVNLQNLLEYETEELIRHHAQKHGSQKHVEFQKRIEQGYVSFKSKCDWLCARSLISQDEWRVMDDVRRLRNDFVHRQPAAQRHRFRYQGRPLLTRDSVRRLFVDVELVLRTLRKQSGRHSAWRTVPPGYASEMNWPVEYVDALGGKHTSRVRSR